VHLSLRPRPLFPLPPTTKTSSVNLPREGVESSRTTNLIWNALGSLLSFIHGTRRRVSPSVVRCLVRGDFYCLKIHRLPAYMPMLMGFRVTSLLFPFFVKLYCTSPWVEVPRPELLVVFFPRASLITSVVGPDGGVYPTPSSSLFTSLCICFFLLNTPFFPATISILRIVWSRCLFSHSKGSFLSRHPAFI